MYSFAPTTRSAPWILLTIGALILMWLMWLAGPGTAGAKPVTAPPGQLWTCHVPEHSAEILAGPEMYTKQGRLMAVYRLDRNADGNQDMLLIHEMRGQTIHKFPRYFIYDKNFDGKPDAAWADEMGNGICGEMTPVDPKTIVMEKDEPPAMEGGQCEEEKDGENDPSNPKKEM